MTTAYDFSATALDGKTVELDSFAGKPFLIVNTASKCGFTPQYAGLEELHRRYHERGLVVLGFPCNQFGQQEPGSSSDIGAFCVKNYGVSFQMFEKIDVNGDNAHPLYQWLKRNAPGILGTERIKWNFTKFLIDRKGAIVARYSPLTKPDALAKPIEPLL
jgi:glutathione peroxidase